VNGHGLLNARGHSRGLDGLLDYGLVDMMTPHDAGTRIRREGLTREHPEPPEVAAGMWILASKRVREPDAGDAGLAV
jgi:hypothetical protein